MQAVVVVRGDELWEYRRDLGPAEGFKAEQINIQGHIPLGNGHFDVPETVERMLAMADDWRDRAEPGPRCDPPDFHKAFEEISHRRYDARVGRKRFVVGGN